MTASDIEIIVMKSNADVSLPLERCSTQVIVGAFTKTHLEHHGIAVEEFLAMHRFDQRHKLVELPTDLNRSGRYDFI